MASRTVLRASDADRDAVSERLRTAAAEGRLDTEELDERVGAALRARTYGELDTLLVDLPSGAPARRVGLGQVVPAFRSALAVMLPIAMTVAVVAAVVAVAAVAAAWWALWALVWFFMCGRGCTTRRIGSGRRGCAVTPAHRMRPTRPAGLH